MSDRCKSGGLRKSSRDLCRVWYPKDAWCRSCRTRPILCRTVPCSSVLRCRGIARCQSYKGSGDRALQLYREAGFDVFAFGGTDLRFGGELGARVDKRIHVAFRAESARVVISVVVFRGAVEVRLRRLRLVVDPFDCRGMWIDQVFDA